MTLPQGGCKKYGSVLIYTFLQGVTWLRLIALYVSIPFQLTHSKWSVTYPLKEFPLSYMFQLTHSKWSVTQSESAFTRIQLSFQLTHSKWSVTILRIRHIIAVTVSTHALQVECDLDMARIYNFVSMFQLTHSKWSVTVSAIQQCHFHSCFNSRTPSGV